MIGSGSQQQLSELEFSGNGGGVGSKWAFASSDRGLHPSGSGGLLGTSGSSGDTSLTLGDWRPTGSAGSSMRGGGSGLESPVVGSRVGSSAFGGNSSASLLGGNVGGQQDAASGGSRFRCGKAAREGKPARTVLATGFERLGSALITLL